jgi:hypothetical protein
MKHRKSSSALGSVNGKYDGRRRVSSPWAEQCLDEVVESAAQVRHRQALGDGEPLDLVEHRGVRRVELVGAEHLAGAHDVQRQVTLEHRPDLNRGSVRAQDQTGIGGVDEESVLHLTSRMVGAQVERVEVEPLGLDLGPLGDLPAHRDEDVADPLGDQLEGVTGAEPAAATRVR